jgi:CHAT domain-containing protein
VADRASYLFNMHFYGQLKKGNIPAVALTQSIKWLREVTNSELQILYASTIEQLSDDTSSLTFYLQSKLADLNNLTQEEKTLKPFDHPYYWCAFTITGKMGLKS